MNAAAKFKVWWIPQVPMKAFEVEVASIEEGAKIMSVLADYDIFQFENRIKPDYCNVGGLMTLDTDGDWVDWEDEETGETDPHRFIESLADGEAK